MVKKNKTGLVENFTDSTKQSHLSLADINYRSQNRNIALEYQALFKPVGNTFKKVLITHVFIMVYIILVYIMNYRTNTVYRMIYTCV